MMIYARNYLSNQKKYKNNLTFSIKEIKLKIQEKGEKFIFNYLRIK